MSLNKRKSKERKRNQRKRGIERTELIKLACEEKTNALEREKRMMKSYERSDSEQWASGGSVVPP